MTRRKALFIIVVGFFIPFAYFLIKRSAVQNKFAAKDLEGYREIIAEIAEMIIPRTESPGAKDANVENYIINVMLNCESKASQSRFVQGLERLQQESWQRFATSFPLCSNENKTTLLKELEDRRVSHPLLNKVKTRLFGLSFFDQIKQLTVKGYCTSKMGATEALAYDPVPKKFISCIPYITQQKAWATR